MSLLLGPFYPNEAPAAGAVALAAAYDIDGWLGASFRISYNGLLYETIDNHSAADVIGPWISPQVGMLDYQCMATANTTLRPPGTYDEWLELDQTWTWGWAFHPIGSQVVTGKSGSFHLKIRRKSDLVVVDECDVTVTAEGNA